jgi:FkbM family methyltransferase
MIKAFAQWLKDNVKSRPPLFDFFIRRIKRQLLRRRNPAYDFLDEFSRSRDRRLTFVQIGANDGLRNDPVREFVVRDEWTGVLIEPLPTVFSELQQNYRYLAARRKLAFENVAISSDTASLPFYTFREDILQRLTREGRLDMLRKSSFDKAHVVQFARHPDDVVQVDVPCTSIAQVIGKHFPDQTLDLLIIDAEGHETTILRSIDFATARISAIFFESRHLGVEREPLLELLTSNGYVVREAGEDAFASKPAIAPQRSVAVVS